MDDDKQQNKDSTVIHSKPGQKTLLQNQGGMTGSHKKQVSASNVKRAIDFLKQEIFEAKGGKVHNASEMGHSTKPTSKNIHHTQRFDTVEEAEQFAKENGLDPNQITEDNNIYGKPKGYRIDWKESKASEPVSELSTHQILDDQAGNERSRYLHGDEATAKNYMESKYPNDKIKEFTKAMMKKLMDKNYEIRSDYFNNGDFYYDVFDNLMRYGMNPDEALKHLDEEYVNWNNMPGSDELRTYHESNRGVKFYRADNDSKPGRNDAKLNLNPDNLQLHGQGENVSNTLDKGQGVADQSPEDQAKADKEASYNGKTATVSNLVDKTDNDDNEDIDFVPEGEEEPTEEEQSPEDELLGKLFSDDDDDNK